MNKLVSSDEQTMSLEEFGELPARLEFESGKSEAIRTWLSKMTFGMISEEDAIRNIELELKDGDVSPDAMADDVFVIDMKMDGIYKLRVGLFFIPVRMGSNFSMSVSKMNDLFTAVFERGAAEALVPGVLSRVWPVIIGEAALRDPEFWVHSTNTICGGLTAEDSDSGLSKWESGCPYGLMPCSVGVLVGNEEDDIDDYSMVGEIWSASQAYVTSDAFKDELVSGLSGIIQDGVISNLSRPTIAKGLLGLLEIETISEQEFDACVSEAYGQETFDFDAFVEARSFNAERSAELLKEALLSITGTEGVWFGGH